MPAPCGKCGRPALHGRIRMWSGKPTRLCPECEAQIDAETAMDDRFEGD